MKKIIDLKNVSQYTAIIIGIILAAFPQIVKWIFYSTGAFIIIFNIAKYFILRNKEKHYSLFKMFMYSMFGALLILVPAFLEIGIPLVAGAFIFMNGKMLSYILENHNETKAAKTTDENRSVFINDLFNTKE